MMKTMSMIIVWLLLFLKTIKSHTVGVCTSVSNDGTSVSIYLGTYHTNSEISGYMNPPSTSSSSPPGLLLTDPVNRVQTEYLLTSMEVNTATNPHHAGEGMPADCLTMYCDCTYCTRSGLGIVSWIKRVEPTLYDGVYDVIPTSHTIIETPLSSCVQPWQFTIQGSAATATPTGPSTPPTASPVTSDATDQPSRAPTEGCTSDAECGLGGECEPNLNYCICQDGFIGDPPRGQPCQLQCPHGNDTRTFNWDTLTEDGVDIPEYNMLSFAIIPDLLAIDITIELDYLGNVTADDERVGFFGVTYVLDFEDFDAHEDAIDDPGTCQNREASDFAGKDFADDYWRFSAEPHVAGNLGVQPYLAYPPPGNYWTVHMQDCGKVVYSGIFTWEDLRGCNDGNGGPSYTHIETDDNWLNLTGTFYVNVVSPFWPDGDYGYYRVYQILSQPFVIAVSSVVHVLGSTGINLMTLSVIAVYKEDQDNDFKLVLLTETADYLKLTRDSNSLFIYTPSNVGNTLTTSHFTDNTDPENMGTNECLGNKDFICSQLWEVNATNIGCTTGGLGTDFSGNYALSFTPVCRSTGNAQLDAYCASWLNNHQTLASPNGVALNSDLTWVDAICDPIVFTVQFEAAMSFYTDSTYQTEADDNHLYQVGEDRIYVEVNTTFPDDTLDVFNVTLIRVYICTFDPLFAVPDDPRDMSSFGCINPNRDDYDKFFHDIYDKDDSSVKDHSFTVDSEGFSNVVRFSFDVPPEVARDTLYVQAELFVALQELGGLRGTRRLAAGPPQANQIQDFVQTVGIDHGQKRYYKPEEQPEQPRQNPPQEYYPPQNPVQPVQPVNPVAPVVPNAGPATATWTINLSSPWVIAIGGLLGLVLTFNIAFMTYTNCCRASRDRPLVLFGKRKGYKKVKIADSEDFSANDSEANAINVVSDE